MGILRTTLVGTVWYLICVKISGRAYNSLKSQTKTEGGSGPMAEIVHFLVVPFDYVGGDIVAGEPVRCRNPAEAIQRAQALWKTFGHAGAIAFSRTNDFEVGKFGDRQILRRFGQVPSEY